MKVPLRKDIFHIETKPIAGALTVRQAICFILLALTSTGLYAVMQLIDIPLIKAIATFAFPVVAVPFFIFGWYKPKGGFRKPEEYLIPLLTTLGVGIARALLTIKILEESRIIQTNWAKRIMSWGIYVYEPDGLTKDEAKGLLGDVQENKRKKTADEYECARGNKHSKR